MVDAWRRAMPAKLATLMNDGLKRFARARQDAADRPQRALGGVDQARLSKPGTVFVAVGAGHLAGQQSVHEQLKALKLTATRVAIESAMNARPVSPLVLSLVEAAGRQRFAAGRAALVACSRGARGDRSRCSLASKPATPPVAGQRRRYDGLAARDDPRAAARHRLARARRSSARSPRRTRWCSKPTPMRRAISPRSPRRPACRR